MKKITLFLVLCFFCCSLSWAQKNKKQEPIFEIHKTDSTRFINQFGMNISPLLIQIMPLNRGSVRTGPYGFSYTRINHKNKVFRMGLGVFINDFDTDNSHLNLRIGGGKIRKVGERWHLMTGWDFNIFGGSFNIPRSGDNDDDGGIGFGPYMGLQYYLTQNVCFSTESFLFMGTTSNTPVTFRVIPPIAIFVHINFVGTRRQNLGKRNFKTQQKRVRKKEKKSESKSFIENE